MKKIYMSIAIFAMGANMAFGQVAQQKMPLKISNLAEYGEAPTANTEKALGASFWLDDFSNPATWVADNNAQPSPFGWNIGATSNTWWAAFSGGINSTSGGNYAEVYNGDYNAGDQAVGVVYNLTTAAPIDVMTLAGTDQVSITFEQYGALFNDQQEVQVSTDGINFVTVGSNADQPTYVGNNPSAIYPNPMLRTFNIAPYITGNASAVWIRFNWTSAFSASSALGAWTTFGWFIDDVNLVTNPDNDLNVTSSGWGSLSLPYYQIPLSQVAPIDFWAKVINEGLNTQTTSTLTADINAGSTVVTSPGSTIAPGAIDSLVTASFTPSALGNYAFTWGITADLVDDIPANNALVGESFDVVTNIYARDAGGTPQSTGGGEDGNVPGDFAFEAGNFFDVFFTEPVYGVDVVIGTGTPDQTIIYGKIYMWDGAAWVYVDETAEYNTTLADASNNATVTLQLYTSPTLTAGTTYLVVVGCYSEFYYGTSGKSSSVNQSSFVSYPTWQGAGSQYYTTQTPMVRLNFDNTIGIAEVSESGISLGQNMPNPFNNNSTINFELNSASDVQFEFVDMTGKIVKTMDLGKLTAGSHNVEVSANEFAAGVYYYSLISGENKITSKMIVQK